MSATRACEACKRPMGPGDIRMRNPRTGRLECTQCINHPVGQPNKIDVTAAARQVAREDNGKDQSAILYSDGTLVVTDYQDNELLRGTLVKDVSRPMRKEWVLNLDGKTTEHPTRYSALHKAMNHPLRRQGTLIALAHDGGDGQVVRHCFSCGSGGVVGRSDGSVECTVCETVFTVQVQPSNVASPQTVNGQPVHIPGMPEESEVAPSTEVAPAQPEQPGPGSGEVVPTVEDADLAELVTASGQRLDEEHYAQYLALGAPGVDRKRVLGMIRQANVSRRPRG